MELVLKLPKNKPPFIGVLFNYENDAVMKNHSTAEHEDIFTHELLMDPSHKLHITMYRDNHFSEKYEVNYDPVALLKFLYHCKNETKFSFGHLVMKDGKLTVPKTRKQNKPLLFKISSIKIPILVIEN